MERNSLYIKSKANNLLQLVTLLMIFGCSNTTDQDKALEREATLIEGIDSSLENMTSPLERYPKIHNLMKDSLYVKTYDSLRFDISERLDAMDSVLNQMESRDSLIVKMMEEN